ncbi:DUF2516 family protein [Nakamurella lactea]|uniref:DUF2516 family protein n=1 Tax=Nakamurella lactea TaxID=459515 RepID=UPI000421374A|nr:DUF2516 family protein [Nakamurella lactea]
MTFVVPITHWITLAMGAIGAVVGVFAFVDAVIRRADAFPAADKQTKVTWTGITALSGVLLVLGLYPMVFPPPSLLWLAGMIGSLVYLLDVRPRLREVTGGSSHW